MVLSDVNLLVYAFRNDTARHSAARRWLFETLNGGGSFAVSEFVLSSVVRIVTNPRIFYDASPLETAIQFANAIRNHPRAKVLSAGKRHWQIFVDLCRATEARGNVVPDAYLAALAIEQDIELATADRGFKRFPGLRWTNPLA